MVWNNRRRITYSRNTGEYKESRNNNGLLSININVVKCNPSRKTIFIGTFDGYLDIANEDSNWTHITDIVTQKFTNPQIEDIEFPRFSCIYLRWFWSCGFQSKFKCICRIGKQVGKFPAKYQCLSNRYNRNMGGN